MKRLPLTLLSILAACSAAKSATIIDWGGDYVSSSVSLNVGTSATSGNQSTWDRMSTTPLSPSSNYNGTAFYGTIQNNSSNGPAANYSQTQVVQNPAGDVLTLGWTAAAYTDKMIAGLVYFKQADFLTYSSGAVSFDNSTNSSINIAKPTGSGNNYYVKAAVLSGGQWYLSNSQSQNAQYSAGLSIANAGAEMWGSFNPSAATLTTMPVSYTTQGTLLTNITAVGFYYYANRTGGTTGGVGIAVSDITFTAVPEPAAWALLAAGGSALMIFRKRRSKNIE